MLGRNRRGLRGGVGEARLDHRRHKHRQGSRFGSLAVMNFIMALEDEYDISMPLDRIAEVDTVGDLARTIEALRNKA